MCTTLLVHYGGVVDDRSVSVLHTASPRLFDCREIVSGLVLTLPDDLLALCRNRDNSVPIVSCYPVTLGIYCHADNR
jgi:hypothetical protein